MNRRTIILLGASHVAAAAVGVFFALRPAAASPAPGDGVSNASSGAKVSDISRGAAGLKSLRPVASWRSAEFRRAWKAVRTAGLTTPERLATQKQLLAEWAKRDLTSALDAALEEAWDDDVDRDFGYVWPLGEAFSDVFAEQPEPAWDLIEGGRYGVGAGMLRHLWLSSAGARHPLLVASKLADLSWRFRDSALGACSQGFYSTTDEAERTEILHALAVHPEDLVSVERLAGFVNSHVQVEDLQASPDPADPASGRVRMAKAWHWGMRMSVTQADELEAALDEVPADLRVHALAGAVDGLPYNDGALLFPVLELAANEGAWEVIADGNTIQRLQYAARRSDPRAVAEWVTGLPPEPALYQVIHRGVEPFFQRDMQGARDWIGTIEEPIWRDHAYGEYSQQALNGRKDPVASRWALDRIQNPEFRAKAEGWRRDWEKRTAPKAE